MTMLACFAGSHATLDAAVVNYTSLSAFDSVVGPHPMIGFGDLPVGTVVGNQYTGLGVIFADGDDMTFSRTASFPTDGIGLAGLGVDVVPHVITLQFTSPIRALGAEFPGALRIDVFSGATLVGTSGNFGLSGVGFFGGVVSDALFDRAILSDWVDSRVFIDNLHFAAVPEPSSFAFTLIGAGCFWIYGRRKTNHAASWGVSPTTCGSATWFPGRNPRLLRRADTLLAFIKSHIV